MRILFISLKRIFLQPHGLIVFALLFFLTVPSLTGQQLPDDSQAGRFHTSEPFWRNGWFVGLEILFGLALLFFATHVVKCHTRRRRAEDNEKYREIVQTANTLIIGTNPQGNITFFNKFAQDFFGYAEDEILGKNIIGTLVSESDQNPVIGNMLQDPDLYKISENENICKNGEHRRIRWIYKPLRNKNGNIAEIFCIGNDITETKNIEHALSASLREKEVLLRETHHRVKNNLQVVISLLRSHSKQMKNKQLLDILRESQNRIKAMALIHETLFQSSDVTYVDFGTYLDKLTRSLLQAFGTEEKEIRLKTDAHGVSLVIDDAIPVGLVINELVTNSLKYAFPDNSAGEIEIKMRTPDPDQVELLVSDNGVGLPEKPDISAKETLGLTLVRGLVELQLDGHIELERNNGAKFIIRFRREKKFERSNING
jgi:PAS domain S-box-containing protein